MPWPRPARCLIVGMVTALAVITTAVPAHAADTVAGGRLDWGIKKSFVDYVSGPIASGGWSLVDGAATVGDSGFRFHSATGEYDPGSGALDASYSGGVHFLGHEKEDGSHELDLTIGNPRVELGGGKGTVHVDIATRTETRRGVAFGDLELSGVDTSGASGSVALSNVPVTLTAEGAKSFEGYYSAGQELDPLSLTGDLGGGDDPGESPSKDKTKKGEFTGAIVDWGVRRTFREYVTGDIAEGEWKLSDGAQDGGALFRFAAGEGDYGKKRLTAKFDGTVTFTGTGLDLRLSAFAVSVKGGKGKLSATVDSEGGERAKVTLVTFAAKSLEPDDGLILLDEVPTRLTAEGAKAFNDLYPEGTEMDPVTIAAPVTADAVVPPLPDIGAEPSPTASATDVKAVAGEPGPSGYLWVVAAVAVVLLALTVWALVLRRRGRTAGGDPSAALDERTAIREPTEDGDAVPAAHDRTGTREPAEDGDPSAASDDRTGTREPAEDADAVPTATAESEPGKS